MNIYVDVRSLDKFVTGTIEENNSQVIPMPKTLLTDDNENLSELMSLLPSDQPIITVCTTGNSAAQAAAFLREKGFNAEALPGGLSKWLEDKQQKDVK